MVTATGNSAGQSLLSQLLQNAASSLSATSSTPSPNTDADQINGQDGPPTNVTLSDNAKAILARAQEAQAVAERLQQAVDQAYGKGLSNGTSQGTSLDLSETLQQIISERSQTTGGSQTASSIPDGQVKPLVSFSNSIQADGYTISVQADAQNGASNVTITAPNGSQIIDKVDVGGGGGVTGGAGPLLPSNVSWSEGVQNNTQTWTFYSSDSVAENVATTSAGSVSASAANARSSSVSFAINFSTGTIAVVGSDQAASATAEDTPTANVTAVQLDGATTAKTALPNPLSPTTLFL